MFRFGKSHYYQIWNMTICKYLKLGIKANACCILSKYLMIAIDPQLLICMYKSDKSDSHDSRFHVNNILITITFVLM